jgi:hypothetical protein
MSSSSRRCGVLLGPREPLLEASLRVVGVRCLRPRKTMCLRHVGEQVTPSEAHAIVDPLVGARRQILLDIPDKRPEDAGAHIEQIPRSIRGTVLADRAVSVVHDIPYEATSDDPRCSVLTNNSHCASPLSAVS